MVIYLVCLFRQNLAHSRLLVGVALVITMVALTTIFTFKTSSGLMRRINITFDLLSDNIETTDNAASKRLSLWQPATRIIHGHWINGVGPRCYCNLITECTNIENYLTMFVLGILTETGIIGFNRMILFWGWSLFVFTRSELILPDVLPWALALLVTALPFNTHIAFYGSFWSTVIWWLLAILISAANIHISKYKSTRHEMRGMSTSEVKNHGPWLTAHALT